MAVTTATVIETASIIVGCFKIIKRAAGVELNTNKTEVINVSRYTDSQIAQMLEPKVLDMSGCKVEAHGKHVGLYIGPGAGSRGINMIREKFIERVMIIKSLKMGLSQSMALYNTYCFSTLQFTLQYAPACVITKRLEDRGAQLITNSPRHAIPTTFLQRGREAGMRIAIMSAAAYGAAAAYRAAVKSAVYYEAVEKLSEIESDENRIIGPRYKEWAQNSIISHMAQNKKKVETLVSIPSLESDGFQRKIMGALLPQIVTKDPSRTAYERARHWDTRAEEWAGRKILQNIHRITSSLPNFVAVSYIKTLFNAWPTTRRYGQEVSQCKICGTCEGDSLRHYLRCQEMWDAIAETTRQKGPWDLNKICVGLLTLNSEGVGETLVGAIHCDIALSAYCNLKEHARQGRHEFVNYAKARLRHVAKRDPRITRTLGLN